MRKTAVLFAAMASLLAACAPKGDPSAELPRYKIVGSDIIVDASDLVDDIPRQHLVQTASSLGVDWIYNDFALQFRTHASSTVSNYFKDVTYPEDGTYYLYVRAVGQQYAPYGPQSKSQVMARLAQSDPAAASPAEAEAEPEANGAFRVRVNDAYVDGSFGDVIGARMTRAASFNVSKGDVAHLMITRITGTPALDCIVLSKNPNLTEDDLKAVQLPEYTTLLHEYDIHPSSCVKFGDLTGDGKTDFVVFSSGYSSYAYDNSGELMWSWEAPEENTRKRAEFECPGLVWDFDRDGRSEVVQWKEDADGEWLVMADGLTGEELHRTPWPTAPHPHVYNNFRLAVANTDGVYPASILLYSDCGVFMTYGIYDSSLNEVWRHVVNTKKDHLGHYFYAHDLDADGVDEIIGGFRVLDAAGNIIWSRLEDIYDNHDHADTYRFMDMNGDGKDDVIIGMCDLGAQVRDAVTGELMSVAPAEHTQQLTVGKFLDGYKLPQIMAGARIYRSNSVDPYLLSQIYWIDSQGNLISRWPANGLNGNPDIVQGDWWGDGSLVPFWYRFLMQRDGKGKLMCIGDIYHCFDFDRKGSDQVITLTGGKLRVYGYTDAPVKSPNLDPDFLKEHVANHTHY